MSKYAKSDKSRSGKSGHRHHHGDKKHKHSRRDDTSSDGATSSYDQTSTTDDSSSRSSSDRYMSKTSSLNSGYSNQSGAGGDDSIDFSEQFLSAAADVAWKKVELTASVTVRPSDLMAQFAKEGHGDIIVSLAAGNLRYGTRDGAEDFRALRSGSSSSSSKKTNSKESKAPDNDIVKKLQIKHLTASGLGKSGLKETIIGVNVHRYEEEGYYGESPTVNKILKHSQLRSDGRGITLGILDRQITNQEMLFRNQFPHHTAQNVHLDVKKLNKKFCVVNLDSPIISVYNRLHPDAEILEASSGLEKERQVKWSRRKVAKYLPMTVRAMRTKLSTANLTGDEGLVLRFSAPIPTDRLERHLKYKETNGKEGKPWFGFAEQYHQNSALNEPIELDFIVNAWYRKGGKEVSLGGLQNDEQ